MSSDHEFRRAIEEIKLRAPIDSIVGETVELKARGRSLWGCCPFHEERTPSFKVDAAEGMWYCFGACRTGGDVIRYVQQRGNMTFMDALELLAAQVGVELPRRTPRRTRENDPGLAALEFAAAFYRRELSGAEGRAARDYLVARGFGENAVDAFGLGWAPERSQRFMAAAEREGIPAKALLDAGLARRSDRGGDLYAFFRGRLMIPIRDDRGQVIGFGGRIVGEADAAKYVNTSETPYFSKGRVIYALDRAIESVRRGGHLVLVEGYTDVIAAHAAGMPNVGAVLGTATTEHHAALVRRAGATRVSLVFDGDEAGRKAAWRGLEGLLPLDMRLEVVPLPEGQDPADILMAPDGAAAFGARIETGISWFEFIADCVETKRSEGGRALALEVDRALGLFLKLPRPVEVDTAVVDLGARLELPADTLRAQLRSLKERRPRPPAPEREAHSGPRAGSGRRGRSGPNPDVPGVPGAGPSATGSSATGQGETHVRRQENAAKASMDPATTRAYESLVAAALADVGLIPRLRPWVARCPIVELQSILQTLLDLWENEDSVLTPSALITALGPDPSAQHVPRLCDLGGTADDSARLLQGAVEFLEQREHQEAIQRLQHEIQDLESRAAGDPAASEALDHALRRLLDLRKTR